MSELNNTTVAVLDEMVGVYVASLIPMMDAAQTETPTHDTTPENVPENVPVAQVNYVHKMSQLLNVTLTTEEVMNLASLKDRKLINNKLLDKSKEAPSTEHLWTLTPAEKVALTKVLGKNSDFDMYKRNITKAEADLVRAEQMVNDALLAITENRLRVKLTKFSEDTSLEVVNAVNKLLQNGWYKFVRYDSSVKELVLETPRIILKWIKEEIGVNASVDLGTFMVHVMYAEKRIKVIPCNYNINADGYYHPHIGQSSEVCWGNAREVYANFVSDPSTGTVAVLNTIQSLLCTYNDNSPYRTFGEFVIKSPTFNRNEAKVEMKAFGVYFLKEDEAYNIETIESYLDFYDDGNDEYYDGYKVKGYKKYFTELGVYDPDESDELIHLKKTNGTYKMIDTSNGDSGLYEL